MPAPISLTFDAKLEPAIRKFAEMAEQIQRTDGSVDRLTKSLGRALRDVDGHGKRTSEFGAALQGVATRLSAVAVGALSVTTLLSQMQANAEKAAQSLVATADAKARLAQLEASPEALKQAILEGERISLQSGMSQQAALDLVFQQRSFGLSDSDALELARLRAITQDEQAPARFLRGVGKLRASFGDQAGTAKQLASAFLTAGGPSDLDADTLAQAAVRWSGQARGVGASIDEMLALTGFSSKLFASPEMASTALGSLAKVLNKQGFRDQGVVGGLEAFMAAKPKQFEDILRQESEGYAAFQALRPLLAEIKAFTAEVAQSRATGSRYDLQMGVAKLPELTLVQQKRMLELAGELGTKSLGESELKFQLLKQAYDLFSKQSEGDEGASFADSPFGRQVAGNTFDWFRYFFGAAATNRFLTGRVARGFASGGGVFSGLSEEQVIQAALDVARQANEEQIRLQRETVNQLQRLNANTAAPARELVGPESVGARSADVLE